MFINLHYGRLITASIAIVRSGEYRDHVPILTPIITFHDQLMSPGDQRQAVVVIKRF